MTKVDQLVTVELQRVQTAAMATSSASSTSGLKISMFKAKTGFVIPKNKLSGSLVPTFKGVKKSEVSDAADGESNKQMQRKTRWGPDLSQDAAVRKGRALAYQTRVEQITQQLKSGSMGNGDDQHSKSVKTASDHELSSHHADNQEMLQQLELEKQEAIDEILKLNPSYKAPLDYKPVMKEATVPLPVKEHPGCNFAGLIFGPSSDTQKRLEKETGARIQVYGTKSETGEKVVVLASDGSDVLNSYDELYVQISADTYEKVDAAVALIELLVASVSGKSVVSTTSASAAVDDMHVLSKNQDAASDPLTVVGMQNQGVQPPVLGPVLTSKRDFQPYPAPWLLMGQSHGSSVILPVPNTSAAIANNPVFRSPFPFNLSTRSSFANSPGPPAGFPSVAQTSPNIPRTPLPPIQVFQHPFVPPPHPSGQINFLRNPPVSGSQSFPSQPNNSTPHGFTGQHPMVAGPPQVQGPLTSSLPHPISNIPPGRPPEGPLTPLGRSTGWAGQPLGASQLLGPSIRVQMPPPAVSSQRPQTSASQSIVPSTPSLSAQPVSGAPIPPPQVVLHSASSMIPRPLQGPAFLPQNQSSSGMPIQLLAFNSSPNTALGSTPVRSSAPSTPRPLESRMPTSVGSIPVPSFTPLSSMAGTAPRPQQPSSGDFTFQPHGPPAPPAVAQSVPIASSQSVAQSSLPSVMQPPPVPRAPSLPPTLQIAAPQPVIQSHLRPHFGNQVSQHPAVPPVSFAGNMGQFGPSNMNTQMGPRNVSPVPQLPSIGGPFVSRPRSSIQSQQQYPAAPLARPGNIFPADQNFSTPTVKPVASPGGQQVYDPFSPTSVSVLPQPQGSNLANVKKQENDPEYEDLMASVGVK